MGVPASNFGAYIGMLAFVTRDWASNRRRLAASPMNRWNALGIADDKRIKCHLEIVDKMSLY